MATVGQPTTNLIINGPVGASTTTTGIEILSTSFPFPIETFGDFATGLPTATVPLTGAETVVIIQNGLPKQLLLSSVATFRPQRSITSSSQLPILIIDSILNINSASDLMITVPLASLRNGAPYTFTNLPGSHTQTLSATSPDKFDDVTTYTLVAGASITMTPFNDGINAGYSLGSIGLPGM